VDRYLALIPDRPHVGQRELMEPLRRRDAEGVAQVMEAHLETVSQRVVARARKLVADGHFGLETTGRPRRASVPRRSGGPTLLEAQPLAG
jgi:hypothetical protein